MMDVRKLKIGQWREDRNIVESIFVRDEEHERLRKIK